MTANGELAIDQIGRSRRARVRRGGAQLHGSREARPAVHSHDLLDCGPAASILCTRQVSHIFRRPSVHQRSLLATVLLPFVEVADHRCDRSVCDLHQPLVPGNGTTLAPYPPIVDIQVPAKDGVPTARAGSRVRQLRSSADASQLAQRARGVRSHCLGSCGSCGCRPRFTQPW